MLNIAQLVIIRSHCISQIIYTYVGSATLTTIIWSDVYTQAYADPHLPIHAEP